MLLLRPLDLPASVDPVPSQAAARMAKLLTMPKSPPKMPLQTKLARRVVAGRDPRDPRESPSPQSSARSSSRAM